MPWRGIDDPYKIWVSEIILQQTRVNQGWDYYLRFIDAFPTITDLANAPIESVLKIWQGLGYYSRARNMHAAAQWIRDEHRGIFPSEYLQIRSLKGVGDYTAAAVSSIAFKLPYAAVDGNVMRVIARLFGVHDDISTNSTKAVITERCQKMMGNGDPGEFNQAMMEFGALQCVPRNPDCHVCPLIDQCYAYRNGAVHLLPVKKSNIRIKKRHFHYFVFLNETQTILHQRKSKDIWRELFEFPLYESETEFDSHLESLLQSYNHAATPDFHTKHQLSHQLIYLSFYIISIDPFPVLEPENFQTTIEKIHDFPFPIVLASFINDYICGYQNEKP